MAAASTVSIEHSTAATCSTWRSRPAKRLNTAHGHGFIHRDDISPAIFFCTTHGPELLDFGLVKADAGALRCPGRTTQQAGPKSCSRPRLK